jgi:hypothetical protein
VNGHEKDFDIRGFAVPGEAVEARLATPRKVQEARAEHFIMKSWAWHERLIGAPGQTWRLADIVLYFHWRGGKKPFKLARGLRGMAAMPRMTRLRALRDLERRGLVAVEWRQRKSPIVKVNSPR